MAKKLAMTAREGMSRRDARLARVARGNRSMAGNPMQVGETSGTINPMAEKMEDENYPGNMTPKNGSVGVSGTMLPLGQQGGDNSNAPGRGSLKGAKRG